MKTKNVSDLLQVVYELTDVYTAIIILGLHPDIEKNIAQQVKGKGNGLILLPTLKRCHKIIDEIDTQGDLFGPLHDDFTDCIEYLDQNYSIKSKWYKTPENLRKEDFDKISDYLDRMICTLIGYSKGIIFIPSKTQKKHSNKIVKDLDKKTRDDYNESLKCFDFGATTASYMLLCRVAEKMATNYYEKFIQKISKNKNWGNMYYEIKEKQEREKNIHKPILILFDFLRTKRNKAQHPGKRFDSEDCQIILHYLDDFQKEILKHLD